MLDAIKELLEPLGTATRVLLEALSVLTVLYGLLALGLQALRRHGRRLPMRPTITARLSPSLRTLISCSPA